MNGPVYNTGQKEKEVGQAKHRDVRNPKFSSVVMAKFGHKDEKDVAMEVALQGIPIGNGIYVRFDGFSKVLIARDVKFSEYITVKIGDENTGFGYTFKVFLSWWEADAFIQKRIAENLQKETLRNLQRIEDEKADQARELKNKKDREEEQRRQIEEDEKKNAAIVAARQKAAEEKAARHQALTAHLQGYVGKRIIGIEMSTYGITFTLEDGQRIDVDSDLIDYEESGVFVNKTQAVQPVFVGEISTIQQAAQHL